MQAAGLQRRPAVVIEILFRFTGVLIDDLAACFFYLRLPRFQDGVQEGLIPKTCRDASEEPSPLRAPSRSRPKSGELLRSPDPSKQTLAQGSAGSSGGTKRAASVNNVSRNRARTQVLLQAQKLHAYGSGKFCAFWEARPRSRIPDRDRASVPRPREGASLLARRSQPSEDASKFLCQDLPYDELPGAEFQEGPLPLGNVTLWT